jgi:hypothetical protein
MQLRASYSDTLRTQMINGLQKNEAMLTLDWAQKHLPMWHHEKQTDYFGKNGISYHITTVTILKPSLYELAFVHVFEGDDQVGEHA